MSRIIAVDPGVMTGLAYVDYTPTDDSSSDADVAYSRQPPGSNEKPDMEAVNWVIMWSTARTPYPGPVTIVCEDFVPRPGAHSWQPASLHVIGAVRWYCWRNSLRLIMQTAAQGKKFGTNEKLRRIGWFHGTPGGHANDALRHLLLYATKIGVVRGEELLP